MKHHHAVMWGKYTKRQRELLQYNNKSQVWQVTSPFQRNKSCISTSIVSTAKKSILLDCLLKVGGGICRIHATCGFVKLYENCL